MYNGLDIPVIKIISSSEKPYARKSCYMVDTCTWENGGLNPILPGGHLHNKMREVFLQFNKHHCISRDRLRQINNNVRAALQ